MHESAHKERDPTSMDLDGSPQDLDLDLEYSPQNLDFQKAMFESFKPSASSFEPNSVQNLRNSFISTRLKHAIQSLGISSIKGIS